MIAPSAKDLFSWAGDDLLVLAAHPDDEIVGAGGLLLRVRTAAIVFVTDGAPRDAALWAKTAQADTREGYAQIRKDETQAAHAAGGLAPRSVAWLGAIDQEAARAMARLAGDLAAMLVQLGTRVVVAQPYEGGHPDHDACALAAHAAVALAAQRDHAARVVEMCSYHERGDRFVTGAFLPHPGAGEEVVLPLDEAARATKRAMMGAYASQQEVLARFAVEDERFRDAPSYDFRAPPHAGPLHYERRGWARGEEWRAAAAEALEQLGLR